MDAPYPCKISDDKGINAVILVKGVERLLNIVDASVDELVAFISSKSRGRIADPEQTTYLLQKAAQDSYRLDQCLYEPLTSWAYLLPRTPRTGSLSRQCRSIWQGHRCS